MPPRYYAGGFGMFLLGGAMEYALIKGGFYDVEKERARRAWAEREEFEAALKEKSLSDVVADVKSTIDTGDVLPPAKPFSPPPTPESSNE